MNAAMHLIHRRSPRIRSLLAALCLSAALTPATASVFPTPPSSATPPQGSADASPPILRLTFDGLFKQRPAWSPDGKHLAFARHFGDKIWLYLADVETADSPGAAAPNEGSERSRDAAPRLKLTHERRLTDRADPEYDAVWSPDAKRLAFTFVKVSGTQGDVEVYTIAADGSGLAPFAITQGALSHQESPAWSPDGKQLAFTSTHDGNQEIYVAGVPQSSAFPTGAPAASWARLTNDPALDAHPAWSPDGKHLGFATDRWGDLELAAMSADGSNLTRLTHSPGLDDYPVFSPDGRHIAFTSNRDGNFEIYVMDLGDGPLTSAATEKPAFPVRNLTRSPAIDHFAAWTPDGKGLIFVSNRDGGFDLYLLPMP